MHLQGYKISPESYKTIINTLQTVFGNILIWEGSVSDTLVIAGNEELSIDYEQIKSRITFAEPDLEKIKLEEPFGLLANFIMGNKGIAHITDDVDNINSDEHPFIEFAAGKEINILAPNLSAAKINSILSENIENVSGYISNFNNHYEMAEAYIERQNYPRAEKELEMSIKKSGRKKESYNLLGYCYLHLGKLVQAKEMFEKTISINPLFVRPYINLSQIYLKEGNLDRAVSILKDVIRLDPRQVVAYNNLGNIYFRQGRYDKAITQFENAIRINPMFAMPYVHLGLMYLDNKDLPEKAAAALLKAVEIVPTSAKGRYHLGRAYYRLNRKKQAIESFNRAVFLNQKYAGMVKNFMGENQIKGGKR